MVGMSVAMSGFVISLTMVPAAATLCEIAASPFFAALLGRVLLGEIVTKTTWLSMILCAIGIVMFAFDDGGTPMMIEPNQNATNTSASNSHSTASEYQPEYAVLGNALGILSSAGFACYSLTLRVLPIEYQCRNKGNGDCGDGKMIMEYVVRLYGLIFSMWASLLIVLTTTIFMLAASSGPFDMPAENIEYSSWHGVFIFVGFCLFSIGAPKLPAPELILLTLLEVVGGILFTYIAFGETPGALGLAGGCLIIASVIYNGIGNEMAQKQKMSKGPERHVVGTSPTS